MQRCTQLRPGTRPEASSATLPEAAYSHTRYEPVAAAAVKAVEAAVYGACACDDGIDDRLWRRKSISAIHSTTSFLPKAPNRPLQLGGMRMGRSIDCARAVER